MLVKSVEFVLSLSIDEKNDYLGTFLMNKLMFLILIGKNLNLKSDYNDGPIASGR